MKHIQIDTAQLISSLGAILEPDVYNNEDDLFNMIDFISQLVTRDRIFYDGKVHGAQKKVIDELRSKLFTSLNSSQKGILERKLKPIVPEDSFEDSFAIDAGTKAAETASLIARKRNELSSFIKGYNNLDGTDKLNISLKKYLIPHFDGKGSDPDFIRDDKNIVARRFIYSIAKNVDSVERIGGVLRRYEGENQLGILKLIFNLYRAEFARKREDYLFGIERINPNEYFYKPLYDRSKFLEIIDYNNFDTCAFDEEVDKTIQSAWLKLKYSNNTPSPLVPLPFNLVLSQFKDIKTCSKIDVLKAAIDLVDKEQAIKLQKAHSMIPRGIVGGDPQIFLKEIAIDYENQRSANSLKNHIAFTIEMVFYAALSHFDPLCATNAIIPIFKKVKRECRKTKHISKLYIMPTNNLLDNKDLETIFLNIFRKEIPKRL